MSKEIKLFVPAAILFFFFSAVVYGQNTRSNSLLYLNTPSDHQKKIPITKKSQWERKRQQVLDSMQSAMGKLPTTKGLPPFGTEILETINEESYTRLSIVLTVAENEKVAAYLYLPVPKAGQKKFPAMLALHETDDLGKKSPDGQGSRKDLEVRSNLAYAKELAERGYVVIAPDYPSFGDSKSYDFKNDRYESGTMKAIFNHVRCIDYLQTRKEVDPARIGVIGHSLGGHNAMFVGAFDSRLKVVVASCGWTLFDFYNVGEATAKPYGGRLGPWAQERYMPLLREKYQLKPERIPFDFDQVIAAIAPRAFFSNSPLNDSNFDVKGVEKGIKRASEVYSFLGVPDHLQLRTPAAGHDFPKPTRDEAYRYIDKVFGK